MKNIEKKLKVFAWIYLLFGSALSAASLIMVCCEFYDETLVLGIFAVAALWLGNVVSSILIFGFAELLDTQKKSKAILEKAFGKEE